MVSTGPDAESVDKLVSLEASLLEQEHRVPAVLYNFFVLRNQFPDGDPRRKACIRALLWRFFSLQAVAAAGVGTFAVLGVILAYQANILLARQNEKIDTQNELAEASRRATLIYELTSINERIDALRKSDDTVLLPASLVGRTVALSRSLRPYYYLTPNADQVSIFGPAFPGRGDRCGSRDAKPNRALVGELFGFTLLNSRATALVDRPVSPERAQLLVTLISSNIANFSELISNGLDLRYVDLRGATLRGAQLSKSELQFADLSGANVFDSDFTSADISDGRLDCASALGGRFAYVRALRLSAREARLSNSDFSEAALHNADFERALIYKVNFTKAVLKGINLDGAIICTEAQKDAAECKNWLERTSSAAQLFNSSNWRVVVEKGVDHPWLDATSNYLVLRRK